MQDKTFLKLLGQRISQIRKEKEVSQVELAEKLGTFHTQIGRIERGEVNCTINSLRHIAEELKVSLSELLDFEK